MAWFRDMLLFLCLVLNLLGEVLAFCDVGNYHDTVTGVCSPCREICYQAHLQRTVNRCNKLCPGYSVKSDASQDEDVSSNRTTVIILSVVLSIAAVAALVFFINRESVRRILREFYNGRCEGGQPDEMTRLETGANVPEGRHGADDDAEMPGSDFSREGTSGEESSTEDTSLTVPEIAHMSNPSLAEAQFHGIAQPEQDSENQQDRICVPSGH